MPVLTREVDLYPDDLLERERLGEETDDRWWALYTRSRREKDVMRRLLALDVPFYGPVVPQRHRSPSGRMRTSFLPLFANYIFMYGDASDRYKALTTNCVSRDLVVSDGAQLSEDLRQIHHLIVSGMPITVEERLQPGALIRVRSGPMQGREGQIAERRGKRRLIVIVNFLQQGVSVELDDFEVERII